MADHLKIISPKETKRRTSLGESTIRALRQRGKFPVLVRLTSGRIGYVESEVQAWIEERVENERIEL